MCFLGQKKQECQGCRVIRCAPIVERLGRPKEQKSIGRHTSKECRKKTKIPIVCTVAPLASQVSLPQQITYSGVSVALSKFESISAAVPSHLCFCQSLH